MPLATPCLRASSGARGATLLDRPTCFRYTPADLDKDGSSWRLDPNSLGHLLASLPSLTDLVVHTSDHDELGAEAIAAPSLRRLIVRTSASERTMATLGRLDAPALETLELWNPDYAYGWDGKAPDLTPLLNNSVRTPSANAVRLRLRSRGNRPRTERHWDGSDQSAAKQ